MNLNGILTALQGSLRQRKYFFDDRVRHREAADRRTPTMDQNIRPRALKLSVVAHWESQD